MVETFDVSITPYGLTRRTFVYLPDDWQTSGKNIPYSICLTATTCF